MIARPVTPCRFDSTAEILIWASSSSFSTRCCSRVRSCDQGAAVAGEIAQPADFGRLHQRGPAHATLGDLGQPGRIGPVFSELEK